MDKTVSYLAYSAYGIERFGFIFYGQTIVKKLNRNYTVWSALLFFFPGISLVILGQMKPLAIQVSIIELKPNWKNHDPLQLRELTIGTESVMLLDAIQNDSLTLKHMIRNYPEYTGEYTVLFPILATYQLAARGEKLDEDILASLEKYAKGNEHASFSDLLDRLAKMSPQEISMWGQHGK